MIGAMIAALTNFLSRYGIAILLSSALSLSYFFVLKENHFLKGTDTYFYALQAEHWAIHGQVKVPDSSLLHRLSGQLIIMGLTPQSAIIATQAFLLFLISCQTLILLVRTRQTYVFVLATLWLYFSPSLLFLLVEFTRFTSFLVLIPMILYFYIKPFPAYLYAFFPLILSLFMHKAAIPIAGIFTLGLFIQWFNKKSNVNLKRFFALFFSIAIIILLFFYTQLIDRIQWLDLQRLGNLENLQIGILTLFQRTSLPLTIKIELLIALLILILSVFFQYKNNKNQFLNYFLLFICLAIACIPFGSQEVMGVGERYALLFPFFVVMYVLVNTRRKTDFQNQTNNFQRSMICILAFFLVFPIQKYRIDLSHPPQISPDNALFKKVTDIIADHPYPMLIAHKGLNFYYTFSTKRDAFAFEPETHWDKSKIWRLAYDIRRAEFHHFLPKSCQWGSDKIKALPIRPYTLIREDCWFAFREAIKENTNEHLYKKVWHWSRNPAEQRPNFLYRKHKQETKNTMFPAINSSINKNSN